MKSPRIAVITLTGLLFASPALSADAKATPEKQPAAQATPAKDATPVKETTPDNSPSRRSLSALFSNMPGQSHWDGYLGVTGRAMDVYEKATIVPSLRIGTAWNSMGLMGITGSWLQTPIQYAPDRPITLSDYGVYAGWTVHPSWYVNGTLLVAYKKGSVKIKEVSGDPKADSYTYKAIEPTFLLEVNITDTFRIGGEYGMRTISGSVPPELQTSDLGTKYMGLTFTFLGQ